MTPEFLDGPVARDYREILEAATTYEAATRQKPGTGGTKCKSDTKGCNVPTGGNHCKTGDGCGNVPTGGTNCKSDRKACPKKQALPSNAPGWSLPPSQPVA